MSKAIPPIQKYMTTSPLTISQDQTIAQAAKVMGDHHIRHLPVLKGEKLVGVLSDRDVSLIQTLSGVDAEKVKVSDAMTPAPYTTDPHALVSEVAAEMAEKKYGSAIVVQNEKVVGVFTTVDACRVLAEVFETRLK